MKVLVAGDFCPQNRVSDSIRNKSYSLFSNKFNKESDYAIVNLECPIYEKGLKKIKKCGPSLCCDAASLDTLKGNGFDCVSLANNHILDYGSEGLMLTIEKCKERGIDTVGAGKDYKEASRILIKEINGEKIGIINCCEHEFSISGDNTAGTNPLNPISQYYAIKEAKQQCDYVLVIIHGGHEHYQYPTPRMIETYRFFVDAGADAVVNHHQHCLCGYETYCNKPIFYGLGNFCFDWKGRENDDKWTSGFMVCLSFSQNQVGFEIYPYSQCTSQSPTVDLLDKHAFDIVLSQLNENIRDRRSFEELTKEFYKSKEKEIAATFSPFNNRFIFSLMIRGLFPSFLSKEKKRLLRLYLDCDVHRDKSLYYFKKY